MSSLATYRAMVPEHADPVVADATVELWLAYAAKRHDPAVFGSVFTEAMVFYAAHHISRLPGVGGGNADEAGPVLMQRDGDLQRQYGQIMTQMMTAGDADLATTRYGLFYLQIRDSRAGTKPTTVVAG